MSAMSKTTARVYRNVGRAINDVGAPSVDAVEDLADALGVDVSYLFEEEDPDLFIPAGTHRSWCDQDKHAGFEGPECVWEAKVVEGFVNVDGNRVHVWSGGHNTMAPDEAVEMAARTVEAAALAAGHSETAAAFHRDLVRAIGAAYGGA